MSRLAAALAVAAALAGCASPCLRIQQQMCACRFQTSDQRRSCETAAENQERLDPPSTDELAVCDGLEEGCATLIAEQGCGILEVDEGKRACGLSAD